jgi:hypothetical protein
MPRRSKRSSRSARPRTDWGRRSSFATRTRVASASRKSRREASRSTTCIDIADTRSASPSSRFRPQPSRAPPCRQAHAPPCRQTSWPRACRAAGDARRQRHHNHACRAPHCVPLCWTGSPHYRLRGDAQTRRSLVADRISDSAGLPDPHRERTLSNAEGSVSRSSAAEIRQNVRAAIFCATVSFHAAGARSTKTSRTAGGQRRPVRRAQR